MESKINLTDDDTQGHVRMPGDRQLRPPDPEIRDDTEGHGAQATAEVRGSDDDDVEGHRVDPNELHGD